MVASDGKHIGMMIIYGKHVETMAMDGRHVGIVAMNGNQFWMVAMDGRHVGRVMDGKYIEMVLMDFSRLRWYLPMARMLRWC